MEWINVKKIFKIILIILAIVVVVGLVLAGIVLLDVPAYTATGLTTFTPTGASVGKALVVYDPGLTGAAKTVAEKVALNLQSNGYTVDFAGIKSGSAANPSGYNIIVAGGPIYAGGPTGSVKDFLSSLGGSVDAKVGVFGSGSGAQEQSDIDMIKSAVAGLPNGDALSDAVVVKIGSNEDIKQRTSYFVAELIE